MNESAGIVLGVDVGGTKIAAVGVDARTGALVAQSRWPLNDRPIDQQVVEAARQLLRDSGDAGAEAIGIAVPGIVEDGSGVMRLAVNVDAGEIPIGPLVSSALGIPAFVDHDARAAAAWLLERGDQGTSFAYLSVGTGISVGACVDGQIVRGAAGLAGEIGHTQAVDDGLECPCGLRGCLETVAAGPAVERLAREGVARGAATTLTADAHPVDVYRAAAGGDPLAGAITAEVGTHLARAIRGLVLLLGIRRVVIGGGMSRAGEPFLRPILDELARERDASALMRAALTQIPVELLPPDTDPGAWGAVAIARAGLIDGTASVPRREVTDD
jgi:predicted NBD/HSP70 family sugar kinase